VVRLFEWILAISLEQIRQITLENMADAIQLPEADPIGDFVVQLIDGGCPNPGLFRQR
jgi:hypothetical protein